MFNKKLNLYKLEERIVLDAAVTGDATEAPATTTADTDGPLEGIWPVVGQDYTNDGNNGAEQSLTVDNIGSLERSLLTMLPGFDSGVSGQPSLSNDGVLYVGTTGGTVHAINADTGETIWIADTGIGSIVTTPAITADMVLVSSQDIAALDRQTGELIWSTNLNIDGHQSLIEQSYYTQFVNANGDHLTREMLESQGLAHLHFDADGNIVVTGLEYTGDITVITDPLTSKDLAIVGTSSDQNYKYSVLAMGFFHPDSGTTSLLPLDQMDAIGHITAFDMADGSLVWSTPTLDAASGASGGGVWGSQAYDAERNVLYMGVGQMHRIPNEGVTPAFDYSDSLLAINASTGEIIDSVQFTANDAWGYDFFPIGERNGANHDWDVNLHPNLFTQKVKGELVDFVGVGDKSGEYHILQLRADGTMNHVVSLTMDPGAELGGLQATPVIHDGVLTITSHALLEYTDASGNTFAVDPGLVDPTGTFGYKLVDIGIGLRLPEIYINPFAVPVPLADTVRVSADKHFQDYESFDYILNQSAKTTSIDLEGLLKSRDVYKRLELVHTDKGQVQGINVNEVLHLEPVAGDAFVRFVNTTPTVAFGPTTVVGPTDNDPTNDLIIQTFSSGIIKAFDGMGNLVFFDALSAPNDGGIMTVGGGVTVDNDGDLYIGYGLFGGGGIFKYSLPDITTTTADEPLDGIALADNNLDDDENDS